MKLYLDPGHGGTDSGATGHGLTEKSVNLDIALRIRNLLTQNYENVEVLMSRTSDITKTLNQRTDEANSWGADFYLSIHCNAFNGSARGYEDYIHSSLSDSSQTAQYRDTIHEEIIKLNRLSNRGKKKANFHVLRETTMSAMLTENGFIDNAQDAALIGDPNWRQDVAQGHVNGLVKAFNLTPKEDDGDAIYKVIAGSFQTRDNADRRVEYLDNRGIESFVTTTTISGTVWYRVQAGAFSNRENAEKRLEEVKSVGIQDAYILTESTSQEEKKSEVTGHTIQGATYLSPELMQRFVKNVNPDAPDIANYYLELGKKYSVRGDVAFAQAILETDYFRFTGLVQPDQNNYAGIGATGPENSGASFETPEEGVRAHIQHLYAYASNRSLPEEEELVDPRFDLVTRASAPTWFGLNGKWAVPGDSYGQSIIRLYKTMIVYAVKELNRVNQNIDL
ncbi:N-acetylmuramoyl-L-alanine amidase [Piscibacillus halophilus]|uniref:N-acetylmuramoyl-L-alanine amidase n=1 Tax=Piscibacillus halophilus TaxID=571933 RepID=A0A1H9F775_9BACI|nr:N-acetylmuramoyl-L-alanine amidase [Piscibacillus halophilus]SEQ33715.1 N-acetylmuramoyl-L-alanine amidase [Piscibacillus halophilus]